MDKELTKMIIEATERVALRAVDRLADAISNSAVGPDSGVREVGNLLQESVCRLVQAKENGAHGCQS